MRWNDDPGVKPGMTTLSILRYTVRPIDNVVLADGNHKKDRKALGGRFTEATDRFVEEFTQSVSFDQRLAPYDIQGSIAHVTMLARVGVLTEAECEQISDG